MISHTCAAILLSEVVSPVAKQYRISRPRPPEVNALRLPNRTPSCDRSFT